MHLYQNPAIPKVIQNLGIWQSPHPNFLLVEAGPVLEHMVDRVIDVRKEEMPGQPKTKF